MARKVIIDTDMSVDDAVALSMVMFDSRFDVVAITATEGCVPAAQANHNLQAFLTRVDPDKWPRIGMATQTEDAPAVNTRYLYGDDGLGNSDFEVADRQHASNSEKLISDCVRANPDEITVLCLGPLTNLARAIRREPQLATLIDRVVIIGGSTDGTGNVSPCAEFNFYFDPCAAREVLNSRAACILVPLNLSNQVTFGVGFLDELPSSNSRVGDFLRQVMPYTIRAWRQQLGMERFPIHDAVGALAMLEPQLFSFEEMASDIETVGELTRGFLVLDSRPQQELRRNVDVAVEVRDEASQYIIDQLVMAGHKG